MQPASVQDLERLLPRADALVVCLPHTDETAGLLGARELALLPAEAVLVNIGRGPVVDEAALYHALRDGRLYAAGLDVWYHYPEDTEARSHTPPSTYPFHELPNVVMSPHRAGGSTQTEQLRVIHLARLLNTAGRGEPMPNRVDLDAGYQETAEMDPSQATHLLQDLGGRGPLLHLAHANGFPPGTYRLLATALSDAYHGVALPARPLWPGSPPEGTSWRLLAGDPLEAMEALDWHDIVASGYSLPKPSASFLSKPDISVSKQSPA